MLGLGLGLNFGFLSGGVFDALILDTYPGAAAAYGLRKLRDAYSGSAIRVRESGGDTEADIGFDANGDLDTATLLAHTGSNDGHVTTWYDQSGNGNNATQTVQSEQPKIVSLGVIETDSSGLPVVQLDGSDDWMVISGFKLTDSSDGDFASFVRWGRRAAFNTGLRVFAQYDGSENLDLIMDGNDDGTLRLLYGGGSGSSALGDITPVSVDNLQVMTAGRQGTQLYLNINNSNEITVSGSSDVNSSFDMTLGSHKNGADAQNNGQIFFRELIFYQEDKKADRAAIAGAMSPE